MVPTVSYSLNHYLLFIIHFHDIIMTTMASQITSLTSVYPTINSGADQRKHQSSASLAFVWGIHRWPVNSPHKGPVTRKTFTFDDVIMHLPTHNRQWEHYDDRCLSNYVHTFQIMFTALLAVRAITKNSSTFSATNISSNMIWFRQLHDTIKMKSNHIGINYNHNNIVIRSHIIIYNSVQNLIFATKFSNI